MVDCNFFEFKLSLLLDRLTQRRERTPAVNPSKMCGANLVGAKSIGCSIKLDQ